MNFITRRRVTSYCLASLTLVASGCANGGDETDTTAETATAAADTGMAGMNHSGDMVRPAAKDGDHEFLRMMSDHHEGMIQMATEAMTKANPNVQAEAHTMHTKQADEQKKMIAMVQSSYQETITPMVMPSNHTMIQTLSTKTGTDYDRAFYENVIAHHNEGIKMIDDMMPRLSNAEVKQMAEKMKADQQKEVTAMQAKIR